MRITRVYTRRGDRGETDLVGGERIRKDSPRIEAYGTVDELNAAVGVARAANEAELATDDAHAAARRELDDILRRLQNQLF
ncbi:MAG: ATP:cob(I)alamin adenosyltransferase, partial [Deltaproteobacteria bacterium]